MSITIHPDSQAELAIMTESRGRRVPLARTRRQIEAACREEYPGLDDRWSPKQALSFLIAAAGAAWVITYAFALGLLMIGWWLLMLAPQLVRAV